VNILLSQQGRHLLCEYSNGLDLPDEYYLIEVAARQMESYVAALGSGAIDLNCFAAIHSAFDRLWSGQRIVGAI